MLTSIFARGNCAGLSFGVFPSPAHCLKIIAVLRLAAPQTTDCLMSAAKKKRMYPHMRSTELWLFGI
eukprot:scaffold484184_cov45-Prasinocladus_malaysianus.AAC.1